MTFDPEGTFSKDSSIFGMPQNKAAKLHLLPAAWEPTTSFKKGTVNGPKALFEATKQMDLYHPYFKKIYEKGIYWNDGLLEITEILNNSATSYAEKVIKDIESCKGSKTSDLNFANISSDKFNNLIYQMSSEAINKNQVVGLVGGDHSCPFGLIKALNENYKEENSFAIVHIDAHFDFREAYQGFQHSHASIMHNVKTKIGNPPQIFQLGIRDFCESELKFANENATYLLDQEMQTKLFSGKSFNQILESLFNELPENIYISFDIDGLSPEYCPNTGTPVPGGLSYNQATHMVEWLHGKGHKLIGFDLVEISPDTKQNPGEGLDEVIGSRILYALSCFALASA
jgi:agmatinase